MHPIKVEQSRAERRRGEERRAPFSYLTEGASLSLSPLSLSLYLSIHLVDFYLIKTSHIISSLLCVWCRSYTLYNLAPMGMGRASFRLAEIVQMGRIPVYIFEDFPWLPYEGTGEIVLDVG